MRFRDVGSGTPSLQKRRTIGDDRHQDTAEVILDSIDLNFILIE